jgi:hypothetical protein
MVGCNGRFYYRQAFEDSKDSSTFFIANTAFYANEPKKSAIGHDKHLFDRLGVHFAARPVTLRNRSRSTVSPRSGVLFYTAGRILR